MTRMMAIIERDMRKFFRSPALMVAAMVFPLVQLIVLGNAFGGKIREAHLGIVDQDGGSQALRVREALQSVEANARTFTLSEYKSEKEAQDAVRSGALHAALIIPPQFSRKVYEQNRPRIALLVDNSDNFISATFEESLSQLTAALNQPAIEPRLLQKIALDVVELYPYIQYMKYLLPGSIALAMFVSVMIGGGIVYIDDKSRGIHEGYLVTPITKLELVFGLNIAGALKAMSAGIVITLVGSMLAGVQGLFQPQRIVLLLIMIAVTSIAFISMMFLIMVRVDDPLVPRAIFGILNTLMFFPSGAIYPVQAFPQWLRVVAWIDPFTYAVHGFKALLLKETGWVAIWPDVLYLSIFAAVMLTGATLLFKRTL